jgi:chromosome segregation ATPase
VELQIELEAARADRDSLFSEIQALREALEGKEVEQAARRINGGTNLSWEQEKYELRSTIARKDDSIDKLLTDLAGEKLSRAAVERLANSQMIEFNAHSAELQRYSDICVEICNIHYVYRHCIVNSPSWQRR